MKTSEDGLVIEFEKGEEIILPEGYEWINATDLHHRILGRDIYIRGLKTSKSDLEKFIELYRSVGIELKPTKFTLNDNKQRLEIKLQNDRAKMFRIDQTVSFYIWFDESGKFIQQGIWE